MNKKTSFVIVTGMSGAGLTSALNSFEDLGYEVIDNIPLFLLKKLVEDPEPIPRPLCIGTNVRTRDFHENKFLEIYDLLKQRADIETSIVFLECDEEILQRRYTETRRKHPLAMDRPFMDGLAHERQLITPMREISDHIFDTTNLTVHELKQIISTAFENRVNHKMLVQIMSFSYKKGLPKEADLVFDVRFLKNPYYDEALRELNGTDKRIGEFIQKDEAFREFFDNIVSLLEPLIPRYCQEGKSYLSLAIGCTGGQHRSVYIAECLHEWLKNMRLHVVLLHRDCKT